MHSVIKFKEIAQSKCHANPNVAEIGVYRRIGGKKEKKMVLEALIEFY